MWRVRMYMNTGWNIINVPDSPALLEGKSHTEFGVIDCLQRYFLSTITIRAFEDQVIHGDFLKLYDSEDSSKYAYYVINSYTMTSGDTIDLDVTMEPLLTCGGIDNITIIDGMTSRHHLAAGDDIPTEKDPLLIPTKVFIAPVAYYVDGLATIPYKLIVRARISWSQLSSIHQNTSVDSLLEDGVKLDATVDPTTGSITDYEGMFCSTPILKLGTSGSASGTKVYFWDYGGETTHEQAYTTSAGDGCFYMYIEDADRSKLTDALMKLSEYGRDDIVLDAYFVPASFTLEQLGTGDIAQLDCGINRSVNEEAEYSTYYSNLYKVLPDIGDTNPLEIHNLRAYFGDNFAYTFVSPDNNQSVKINPEEFYDKEKAYGTIPDSAPGRGADEMPKVLMSYDLRNGGNMTFQMMPHLQEDLNPATDFIVKRKSPYVISTGSWDTASINYSAVSGGALKAKSYQTSSYLKDLAVETDIEYQIENKRRGLRALNPFASLSANIHQGYKGETTSIMGGNRAMNMAEVAASASKGNEYAKARYDRMLARESEDMEFANSLVPKTQVVSQASGASLINGQGMVVFRNYVSEEDLLRFDKILNKYGCKHTTALTKDMLTNRVRYNYIETQGVSISCSSVPKSVRDELANALNVGLRIWHTTTQNTNPDLWNNPVSTQEES